MIELLNEWGLEIALTVLSASVVGYAKLRAAKLRSQVEEYKRLVDEKEAERVEALVDKKLEEVYQEIEELRKYVREKENLDKTQMSLIIASYRFRLIQLCKEYMKQGYMTQTQYDQLTEIYELYHKLGGNGQAKQYYDKTCLLEIRPDED